jgi:hypothetical protein
MDAASLGLLASAVHANDRWHRVLLLQRATTVRRELLHALFRVGILAKRLAVQADKIKAY